MLKLNLELNRAIEKIKQEKAKLVCIQLPDGLKGQADDIQSELEEKTGAGIILWAGTCFGACDIPLGLDKLGIDLMIQFGHSDWNPKLAQFKYV